eukprot:TRINITY_DN29571_c0_g1_i1.p1 TRINITY_DN29571_c0_g1~~TRINITY_DN29571_c0_g1_i1.p1  ORF type:complete len:350 (+),score=60.34 TRINITY_DN29571_c0_g1_i1:55-1050(+)
MARILKQGMRTGVLADNVLKYPVSTTLSYMWDAFPEIEQLSNFASSLTSARPEAGPASGPSAATAAHVVRQFCEKHSDLVVEPNARELQQVCSVLARLRASAVAAGIRDQLSSWGFDGDLAWQPRLRALRLLEHMLQQRDTLHDAARVALRDLEQLLLFILKEVPQCQEVARHLLDVRCAEPDHLLTPDYFHVDDVDDVTPGSPPRSGFEGVFGVWQHDEEQLSEVMPPLASQVFRRKWLLCSGQHVAKDDGEATVWLDETSSGYSTSLECDRPSSFDFDLDAPLGMTGDDSVPADSPPRLIRSAPHPFPTPVGLMPPCMLSGSVESQQYL